MPRILGSSRRRSFARFGAIFLVGTCMANTLRAQDSPTRQLGSAANRLTYLDSTDPFYPNLNFPKLITPQWVGESGVQAVIILAVDDMTESKRYEAFLRPIIERLKQIDGRAPISIMTRSLAAADEQAQAWLKEGITL